MNKGGFQEASSILTAVGENAELSRTSLKSIIGTKYVLQNEILLDLFGLSENTLNGKEVNIDRLSVNQGEKVQTVSKPLELDLSEIEFFNSRIASLSQEFGDYHNLDGENETSKQKIQQLIKENDQVLPEYCNKYDKLIYLVSGKLQPDEKLTEEEINDEAATDDEGDLEVKEIELPNTSYYRLKRQIKFPSVEYDTKDHAVTERGFLSPSFPLPEQMDFDPNEMPLNMF